MRHLWPFSWRLILLNTLLRHVTHGGYYLPNKYHGGFLVLASLPLTYGGSYAKWSHFASHMRHLWPFHGRTLHHSWGTIGHFMAASFAKHIVAVYKHMVATICPLPWWLFNTIAASLERLIICLFIWLRLSVRPRCLNEDMKRVQGISCRLRIGGGSAPHNLVAVLLI